MTRYRPQTPGVTLGPGSARQRVGSWAELWKFEFEVLFRNWAGGSHSHGRPAYRII